MSDFRFPVPPALSLSIQKQIDFLVQEIARAKLQVNTAGLACTTATYLLVQQYRNSLKAQLALLRMNLE